MANDLIDWVKSFNITLELVKTVFPGISPQLDQFFYDANSFTLAMLSKKHTHTYVSTRVLILNKLEEVDYIIGKRAKRARHL